MRGRAGEPGRPAEPASVPPSRRSGGVFGWSGEFQRGGGALRDLEDRVPSLSCTQLPGGFDAIVRHPLENRAALPHPPPPPSQSAASSHHPNTLHCWDPHPNTAPCRALPFILMVLRKQPGGQLPQCWPSPGRGGSRPLSPAQSRVTVKPGLRTLSCLRLLWTLGGFRSFPLPPSPHLYDDITHLPVRFVGIK
ncbi:unnamed protein product [Rangifer tarandus platyrhynchus]|uniref:Uncharacterized protein n=1 Tax=Rangifer tarandus platyrhynchus TaxID=3082113 RepID=A0ABN8Z3Q1_RANTA|nr:unnamed protein product [Rangifer tarandus platyrhynchus]